MGVGSENWSRIFVVIPTRLARLVKGNHSLRNRDGGRGVDIVPKMNLF
jgi:hypothetical protein